MFKDTIAAISTPLGKSGIGIVRLSGPQSISIVKKIFSSPKNKDLEKVKTFTIHYGFIKDPRSDQIIDEVLLFLMRKPHTYTKEDVVEISAHGGSFVLRKILNLVIREGARLAQPGEFTLRAFLNGRITLPQAEAVLDIVNAKSEQMLKLGISHLLSKNIKSIDNLQKELLEVISVLEAHIEFPEEEIEEISLSRLQEDIKKILKKIEEDIEKGERIFSVKEGCKVVVAGRTNVGKSSLVNIFLEEERMITSTIQGTTRDVVCEECVIEGVFLKIVDTAGILTPKDEVEKKALRKTEQMLNEADLILLMFDASSFLEKDDKILIEKLKDRPLLGVINKVDLPLRVNVEEIKRKIADVVYISCKTGEGIDTLKQKIKNKIMLEDISSFEDAVFSLRHIQLLKKVKMNLEYSLEEIEKKAPLDKILGFLREGYFHLEEIQGKRYTEDVLNTVFSKFCIGK